MKCQSIILLTILTTLYLLALKDPRCLVDSLNNRQYFTCIYHQKYVFILASLICVLSIYFLSRNLHKNLRPSSKKIMCFLSLIILILIFLYVWNKTKLYFQNQNSIQKNIDHVVGQFRMGVGTWKGLQSYRNRIKEVRNFNNANKYFSRVVNDSDLQQIKKHLSTLQSQQSKYQQIINQFYQIKLTDDTDKLFLTKSKQINKFFGYLTSQRLLISVVKILSSDALFYLIILCGLLSFLTYLQKGNKNKLVYFSTTVKIFLLVVAFLGSFFLMSTLCQLFEFDQQNSLSTVQHPHPILKKFFLKRNSISCLNQTNFTNFLKQNHKVIEMKYLHSNDDSSHMMQNTHDAIKNIVQNRIRSIYTSQIDCQVWREFDFKTKEIQSEAATIFTVSTFGLYCIILLDLYFLQKTKKSQNYEIICETQKEISE